MLIDETVAAAAAAVTATIITAVTVARDWLSKRHDCLQLTRS